MKPELYLVYSPDRNIERGQFLIFSYHLNMYFWHDPADLLNIFNPSHRDFLHFIKPPNCYGREGHKDRSVKTLHHGINILDHTIYGFVIINNIGEAKVSSFRQIN